MATNKYLASTVVIGSDNADAVVTLEGYYGYGASDEIVYVAPLTCPDYEALQEAKHIAGVITVRAYVDAQVSELNALQADLKAAQAENARLTNELKLWSSRLTEIKESAWDYQGEWASVDEVYAPNWTQGYKRILAEIEDHKQYREALQPTPEVSHE